MPKINITDKDILAKKELEADWYLLEVTEISEKWEISSGGNNVIIALFTVKGPRDVGVTFKHFFSEKGIGQNWDTLVPFLNCFTKEGEKLKAGEVDTSNTKGRLFEAWCFYDSEGKFPGNKVDKFRKHKASQGRTA